MGEIPILPELSLELTGTLSFPSHIKSLISGTENHFLITSGLETAQWRIESFKREVKIILK